uniref:Uncharacterized protein n=1 Tax=Anguilla anguilla TaxID=7936 RepID=A0A0E9VQE1_ANGAN
MGLIHRLYPWLHKVLNLDCFSKYTAG